MARSFNPHFSPFLSFMNCMSLHFPQILSSTFQLHNIIHSFSPKLQNYTSSWQSLHDNNGLRARWSKRRRINLKENLVGIDCFNCFFFNWFHWTLHDIYIKWFDSCYLNNIKQESHGLSCPPYWFVISTSFLHRVQLMMYENKIHHDHE